MPVAGFVTMRRWPVGLRLSSVAVVVLLLAACGEGSVPTASTSTWVQTSSATVSAPPDLAAVLVPPDGFVPGRDQLSGPITSKDDVVRLFGDIPGRAERILKNGFVRGYLQSWGPPDPTAYSYPPPPTVTAMAIVLEFKSDDGATIEARHARQDAISLGYSPFPVPRQLPNGNGDSKEERLTSFTTTYYQGIAWTRGRRLYSVALTSTERPADTGKIISLALRQDDAATKP